VFGSHRDKAREMIQDEIRPILSDVGLAPGSASRPMQAVDCDMMLLLKYA